MLRIKPTLLSSCLVAASLSHFSQRVSGTELSGPSGFRGGEPAAYDVTLHVDSAATSNGDGNESTPFRSMQKALERASATLSDGKTTKILVRPGAYRDEIKSFGSGMDPNDKSKSTNSNLLDTWMRIDRWGNSGEVIFTGSDDWSVGKGEGGEWTPVPGKPGLYSREWKHNWGLWGGSRGSANITGTEGQRREMVFVDAGDGKGWRRLRQVALETYTFTRRKDTGNAGSWWGPGSWKHTGFAGLDVIEPMSFGVTELSDDPSDEVKEFTKSIHDYQAGTLIEMQNEDGERTTKNGADNIRKSFKQVYAEAPSKAPAALTNRIFIRLPDGISPAKLKIAVALREGSFRISAKNNLVLANLSFEHFNNQMFTGSAIAVGRKSHDWFLTSRNVLLENINCRQNNDIGLEIGGVIQSTIRNCVMSDNGATGLNLRYSAGVDIENGTFERTGWRAHDLGRRYSFIPGGLKAWHVAHLHIKNSLFADNLYKGFYSDSCFEDSTFTGCEFRNNLVGSMHEVCVGPVSYNKCRFTENAQALAIIQASGISADDCDFIDNDAAVIPETKPRTAHRLPLQIGIGTSMLGGGEKPIDVGGVVLSNSRISSVRAGSRIIAQGSQYSSRKNYVKIVRDEGKYSNNRYFLADHRYGFDDLERFSDLATWTAATKEPGAKWDPSLAERKNPKPAPNYPAGFVWERNKDWLTTAGGESDIGRFPTDALGGRPWNARLTRGIVDDAGFSAAKPWFACDLDYLSYRTGGATQIYHAEKSDYAEPRIGPDMVSVYHRSGDANIGGLPVVEWSNPCGKQIAISLHGSFSIDWPDKSAAQESEMGIAILKADGTFKILKSEKRQAGDTSAMAIDFDAITLGAKDKIVFGSYITKGTGIRAKVVLKDQMAIKLK